MGKVLSMLTRVSQRFNAENRAMKKISEEKPTAAPRHPSTLKELERLSNYNLSELHKKDIELNKRLNKVYVVSQDPVVNPEERPLSGSGALPLSRENAELFQYGCQEPDVVSPGRFTIKQAMTFIAAHQTDPQEWTVERISEKYNLDPKLTENLLTYYKVFELHLPPNVTYKETTKDKLLTFIDRNIKTLKSEETNQTKPDKVPE